MADDAVPPDHDPAEAARGWIARMASGTMDGAELARFKAWRTTHPDHNLAFEQQRQIWRAIGTADAAQALPALRAPHRPRKRQASGMIARAMAACAVAATAILCGPDVMMALRSDHHSGAAVQHVTLPDGSLAVLDAQSALALHYSGGERRVEVLRGGVWFQVAHGDRRPFRATALDGVTQDIGTAFELREQGDAVTIGVTQGAVQVHATSADPGVTLHAAQRARYSRGGKAIRLEDTPTDDMAVWRNDELLLHKARVGEAIAAIGHYRQGPVFLLGGGASDTRISAVFRTDRPDEAIDAVAQMAGLSVYRMAGVTVLRPAR